MPVSILDIALHRLKLPKDYDDRISMAQVESVGLPFFGGCLSCQESLGCYNMYPSKNGFVDCHGCIGDEGFNSVEEANDALFPRFQVTTDFDDKYREPTDMLDIEARGTAFSLKWDGDVLNVYQNGKVIGTLPIKPSFL